MPRVKINPVLETFKKEVFKSLSLAKDVTKFKEFRKGKYRPILKLRIHSIVELSFLKLFISWEQFLEHAFTRYMCGARTSSRFSPERFVQPKTLEHALNIIKQERHYVDWTVGSEVIQKAELYFRDGEPFASALGGSLAQLDEMKKIRNRIAHSSKDSEEKFQSLVRQKLGYNPKAMTPGKLLLFRIPSANTKTVLQEYGGLLLVLGNVIVP